MELTFLISRDGKNAKRGHARRACNSCRHKKKRCYHNTSPEQVDDVTCSPIFSGLADSRHPAPQASRRDRAVRNRSASPRCERSGVPSLQNPVEQEAESFIGPNADTPAEADQESRRFACDSNPIATLMEQNESRLQGGRSQKGDVGAWLGTDESSIDRGETPDSSQILLGTHVHPGCLPSKDCQQALIDIYFRRIHPLLPLLDEDNVRSQHRAGTLAARLLQVMCLVAAKDRGAVPFLRLGPDSNPLPLEKFSNILYTDAMQNISRRPEKKVLAIQILALLSLHEWGSTGSEDCSLNLAQAIHHAQTMGLHLLRPDQHSDTSSRNLFWCLWSLDRWNAAMNGRPLMIHDGDRSHGVDDVISTFRSPFRVWLRIADKLGEVIHFYRPIIKSVDQSELDLPSFEDLVEHCEAWDMAPDLLESLELVYHSVIILSTHSSGLQGRSQPRVSKIRQGHSILTIASLSFNQDIRNLVPFPMIGYTVSLAFSVTYKQLRESKLTSARRTAISQIRLFHQFLKEMRTTWWSAAVMTRLGQRVLSNIQPTVDQERSTGPEIDITRLNSAHESTHISPRQLASTEDMQSHSAADIPNVGRRINAGSPSTHPLAGHQLGPDQPLNLEVDSMPFLTATEIEDFDTFFGNFLDLGFKSCRKYQTHEM
ncbi:transcriptional regulator family: Fungal Specific TF [Penicillium roqueforti]|uniref:transcriptional regulator family: Fungal Specific TF n=1 Tax=Penicillium roqueforti TaxID=5082 RepID=UPI0019097020|nr:transcriptional regulator family: Fungal Specific TF [Penicillium roqueforti]KAF9242739.1 transcriptional regulator family: Fungal Specific TF [Penicillium roqueforti]KAI2696684.1 transcriptional regulator family: Fungal Specific TF [Penicillium roqueforti]KAI2714649.1 transcriptional regulator family: Fungal Specific TF [Penicillium roqueforti]KAI2740142.1 transcriptional regulator family: Fungal Specific TF [Penicillium roqueforti]KAI2748851.1 transcriptional regulator family: Fungal Spec